MIRGFLLQDFRKHISYDFPQPLIKKVSLNSLQLFVQADNLLTFSKNQGLDPEPVSYTHLDVYKRQALW